MKEKCNPRTLFLLLLILGVCFPVQAQARSKLDGLVRDNALFAFDIYRELKTREGNIFFSPFSISNALAMTLAGARHNTERQMVKALRFSLAQKDLHRAFKDLNEGLNELQKSSDLELAVANSLWPQSGYEFLDEFLFLMRRYYGVSITPLDYIRAHEAARQRINRWVEERTKEKIKDLIQPGILDALTRLVLVNAIYFKGNWASPFHTNLTKESEFFVSPERPVQALIMTQKNTFRYADLDSLQIIELPYAGNGLSMLILLPKKTSSLKDLENVFSLDNLTTWLNLMTEKEVLIFLPKFKTTAAFRLDEILKSRGMVDAFSADRANFEGMDGRPGRLYIGAVIHKAFVDVNEEGTEAAAATAVVMRAKGIPAPPPTFRADRPFLFLIQEKGTGNLLFMGRVVDPTKTGE